MILERWLYDIFDKAKSNADNPIFVIGHHGKDFFHDGEKSHLMALFEREGVDCYFCGNAHRIGYAPFNNTGRSVHQITCGGGGVDSYALLTFIHGVYDSESMSIRITPHSYADRSNLRWHVDSTIDKLSPQHSPLALERLCEKGRAETSKRSTKSPASVGSEAFARSKRHYNRLCTGVNARFAGFEFDELLFADTKPFDIKLKNSDSQKATLFETLDNCTGNFVFIGEGGSGKTTSLLHVWNEWNERGVELSLYVPLNETNVSKEDNFIAWYINHWYGVSIDRLNEPAILLLDGFNEIASNSNKVLQEIKELSANPRIRIVLTSRYNFIGFHGLEGFVAYDIQLLDLGAIREFLEKREILFTDDWEKLLSTPMMLTLYANISAVRDGFEKLNLLQFKPSNSKGELIYNYLLCHFGKLIVGEQWESLYSAYIALFRVAHYVAWHMETSVVFSIDTNECEHIVTEYLADNENIITTEASGFMKVVGKRYRIKGNDLSKQLDGLEILNDVLVQTFHLLAEEWLGYGRSRYSFRHQHFRDFLSALHITNVIRDSLDADQFILPTEISSQFWLVYVRSMLGDYYGDYCNSPVPTFHSKLHELLDRLRGLSYIESGLSINNILETWRVARDGRIIGEDLTQLDLSHVPLNRVVFSNHKCASCFDGSVISSVTLLPHGHSGLINSLIYSKDGRCVLSTSDDGTIKEWNRETGECLRIFSRHSGRVHSAVYSGHLYKLINENKIIG